MNKVFENIKDNINYITEETDTLDIVLKKCLQKLKDNKIIIDVKGYTIVEFNDNFSKVKYSISITKDEENFIEEIEVIISNNDFYNEIINNYSNVVDLLLIKKLSLKIKKIDNLSSEKYKQSSKNDRSLLSKKQLNCLKDKMKESNENKNAINNFLIKFNKIDISDLTKKEASEILDVILVK